MTTLIQNPMFDRFAGYTHYLKKLEAEIQTAAEVAGMCKFQRMK